jgi:hypothetical protein
VYGGSQTAFLTRIGIEAIGLAVSPIWLAKVLLGDLAFSKFISSPAGQKLLTTGLTIPKATIVPAVGTATRVGMLPQ